MKKIIRKASLFLAGALLTLALHAGVSSAYVITIGGAVDGSGGFTTSISGATVETFDASSLLWSWSGDFGVVGPGSASGQYAAPYGSSGADTTKYVVVPNAGANTSGSATVTSLGGDYNYFGMWWGSVDSYNTLELLNDGIVVASITGGALPSIANGSWTDFDTNKYVNINLGTDQFDSFRMSSTQKAFEADNIAIGKVPEPGMLLLFGSGMAGLVFLRRRNS